MQAVKACLHPYATQTSANSVRMQHISSHPLHVRVPVFGQACNGRSALERPCATVTHTRTASFYERTVDSLTLPATVYRCCCARTADCRHSNLFAMSCAQTHARGISGHQVHGLEISKSKLLFRQNNIVLYKYITCWYKAMSQRSEIPHLRS